MEVRQGGSTLTQQLSKAVIKDRTKTFARKFREALLTLQIEENYTKDEILELYFNVIYLGHGSKGISTAAKTYFRTDVTNLTVPEGALLARMPKAPVFYSPFKNPENAKDAHMVVLNRMAEVGYLPRESLKQIHEDFWIKYWPVVITQSPSKSAWGTKLNKAPYFTEYVRSSLENEVGKQALYSGGLKIYTTLDLEKQLIAQNELESALKKQDKVAFGQTDRFRTGVDTNLVTYYNLLGSLFPVNVPKIGKLSYNETYRVEMEKRLVEELALLNYLNPTENESAATDEFLKRSMDYSKNLHVEGAVITLQPFTNHIVTMVGGSEFSPRNQFNRAMMARRQTGSAFKPFVYGAAINERAVGSGTGIMDAPIMTLTDTGESWSPEDFSGDFRGMVPLHKALALSLNIVSVQVYMKTGPEPIVEFASALTGVDQGKFPKNPALALGVAELTPYEMAVGYATIANGGRKVEPFAVRYVIDQSGNVILNREKEVKQRLAEMTADGTIQVIPESTAYIVRKMLMNVARSGTPAHSLRSDEWANYRGEAAGKTGSTSSFSDAWFAGFDPNYTTIVWMGFDKSSISLGRNQSASALAVPVWGKMYRRFYDAKNYPLFGNNGDDPAPPGVLQGAVCSISGLKPKEGVCVKASNMFLAPVKGEDGVYKSLPESRECDPDKDHHKSVDFRQFLQEQYEISDEEIEKGESDRYKIR